MTLTAQLPAGPTLALLGAKGLVADAVLRIVGMRENPWGEVRLLTPQAESGDVRTVHGVDVEVEPLTRESLDGVDVAVVNLPGDEGGRWAGIAAEAGAVVIDNGATLRTDPAVPLVVPGVNPAQARNRPKGIVAMPGPVTLTVVDALHTLNAGWELTDIVVTALLAASSSDEPGIERLYDELEAVGGSRDIGLSPGDVRHAVQEALPGESPFAAPLAMNLVPHVGELDEDGFTTEEVAFRDETRRVLGMPDLHVTATCVNVPVVSTHSLSVHATFAKEINLDEARQALVEAPAIVALDEPEGNEFPTPVDTVGADPRFAGRLRQVSGRPHTLEFFICADTLRVGAMGVVLTAELVCRELTGAPEPRLV